VSSMGATCAGPALHARRRRIIGRSSRTRRSRCVFRHSLPTLTALQLYVDGTLPVDRSAPVSLEVGGRALGEFFVEWLRCADRHYAGEPMYLRLRAAGDLKTGLPAESASPPLGLPPSPP